MSIPKKPKQVIKKKGIKKKNVNAKAKAKKSTKPLTEPAKEIKRQKDWEINNELISEAFFNSILKNKKFPTYTGIAEQLGLDEKTIRRHLQDENMFEDIKLKMRAIKNKALLTLSMKAIKGESHHWTRLFFEVTDGIKKKVDITSNGKSINQFDGKTESELKERLAKLEKINQL